MESALVVLSGGQDSTTCLYLARELHDDIHAITFDYDQRHSIEIQAARVVAKMAGVATHEVLRVGPILHSTSPLVLKTSRIKHYKDADSLPGGIENTFVPMRNALFLTIAVNRAYELGCSSIYIGVSEEDYGGYPDCRAAFVRSMEAALNLGVGFTSIDKEWIEIQTPLLHKSKLKTVKLAVGIPGCLEALAYSHTCYDGKYPPNPYNHASLLRAKGFFDAHVDDPLIVRAIEEELLPADYPKSGYVRGTPYQENV